MKKYIVVNRWSLSEKIELETNLLFLITTFVAPIYFCSRLFFFFFHFNVFCSRSYANHKLKIMTR